MSSKLSECLAKGEGLLCRIRDRGKGRGVRDGLISIIILSTV